MKLPKPVDEPPGPPWMRMKEKEELKQQFHLAPPPGFPNRLVFNFLQPNGGKRSGSKTEEGRGGGARVSLRPFLVVSVQALESLKGSQSVKIAACLCNLPLEIPFPP